MGARYDVTARLAEGRPVVDDVTEYVAACRQVGYQHLDLDRVAEWYDAQAGLRLDALDADIAALRAAAATADDVASEQAAVLVSLRDGWTGTGAAAAIEFLNRQQRTGEEVSAAVQFAAEALTALHDDLWRAVDAQVTVTLDVGAQAQGRRGAWLAAARALTSGTGDRAAASELLDLEVTPFVDGVIGGRWVPAMRVASDAVAAAYEAALARLGGPSAVFEVPFGFVPAVNPVAAPAVPVLSDGAPTGVLPPQVSPAAFSAPESVTPAHAAPASAPLASAAQPPTPASLPADPGLAAPAAGGMPTGSMPTMPSLPSLGDAGGLGSGATGFGSGLADLLSGQADSADVEPDLEEDLEEPVDEDTEEEELSEEEPEGEPVEAEGEPLEADPVPQPEPEPEPAPTPPAEPLAAVQLPPPPEVPPEPTPCEIAADELPQVGE
jgi:hypothetical protein